MTTSSTTKITTTLSKAELYNLIGGYNIDIVKLESDIPQMEDAILQFADQPENEMAIRSSLHESRIRLSLLKDKVISCRRTLIIRLEMDLEVLEQEARQAPLLDNSNRSNERTLISKELETLRKLVAA